ncbi:hypothetical protein [Microbacterium halotolerans]|uniref:hypothetical protein n=1 Tax=Microbacterium halotolerans TaxID=246613 RepID=UPI000E6ACC5C|nr:hypothetical protein [Microbacterium halotolerans]
MASKPVEHRWHVTSKGEVLETYRLQAGQPMRYVGYETVRTVELEELVALSVAAGRLMRRASAVMILLLVAGAAAIAGIIVGFFAMPATGASEEQSTTVGIAALILLLVVVFSMVLFSRVFGHRTKRHHEKAGLVPGSEHRVEELNALAMIDEPGTKSSDPD